MVISGGENVYSIEVEQALFSHEHIAEISVIGTPHEVWGETVTAVIVLAEGVVAQTRADREAVIARIDASARESLAGFKVPRRFAFVEGFPRTATGKVRKVELRESVQGNLFDV